MISPLSTISFAVSGDAFCTYFTVLSTMKSVLSYRSSFGRWCACTASSTASSCSPNVSATPWICSSSGSCRPIHTKASPRLRTSSTAAVCVQLPGSRVPST
jgi:hypothetical protein